MLAKKEIADAVAALPDSVTEDELWDAFDRLLMLNKARAGLKDVQEGRVYSPEQLREAIAGWRSDIQSRQ